MNKVKLVVRKYNFERVNTTRRRGKKIPTKYWIEGLPYAECQRVRCGPYPSYQEARSDCTGMQLIFDNENFK